MSFYEDPVYLEVVRLNRNREYVKANQLMERMIREAAPALRPHWMILRAEQLMLTRQLTDRWKAAQSVLATALASAPADPEVRLRVALSTILLVTESQHLELARPLLPLIRREWGRLKHNVVAWWRLGAMHEVRLKWHQTYRCQSRTLALYAQLPAAERNLRLGARLLTRRSRGLAAVALGRLDEAKSDLADMQAVLRLLPPKAYPDIVMGELEAYLLLAAGDVAGARLRMQQALELDRADAREFYPPQSVRCDLLAARMARAEGNAAGFRHFCEHARALCQEYDLPGSAQGVQALLAGRTW